MNDTSTSSGGQTLPDDDESIEVEQPTPTDDASTDEATTKIAEIEAKYQRAVADLANYKRQAESEKTDFTKFASERTLVALLPVLDNLKRATEHVPADLAASDWVKGVTAIEQQFEQTLRDQGLKKITVEIGSACDPARQQPISTGSGAKDEILAVLEDGYELHGKVIRPAKVKVGDGS